MLLFQMEATEPQEIKACNCLQDCNSISYEIQVIKTKLENEVHWITYNNVSYWYNTTYYGGLSIAFSDSEFTALKRFASYGTISFLSNVGGLLSLFCGVSVMSFIEIFYLLVIQVMKEFVMFLVRKRKSKKVHSTDLSNALSQIDF